MRELIPHGADVVVDPVGGALSEPALRSLRWGGRFVTVGYASGVIPRIPLNLVLLKGVRSWASSSSTSPRTRPTTSSATSTSCSNCWRPAVAPHLGARFELADTAEALRYVADGRAVGKVVLDIPETGSTG